MRKLLGHIIFSFGERVKLQLVRARTINYMGDFRLQSTPPTNTQQSDNQIIKYNFAHYIL